MPFVYILTNARNTVLYTGVTRNIRARLLQHRQGLIAGFTQKYRVYKLVYFEETPDLREAIIREKQLKGGSRSDKIALVNAMNPTWEDLGTEILEGK